MDRPEVGTKFSNQTKHYIMRWNNKNRRHLKDECIDPSIIDGNLK